MYVYMLMYMSVMSKKNRDGKLVIRDIELSTRNKNSKDAKP